MGLMAGWQGKRDDYLGLRVLRQTHIHSSGTRIHWHTQSNCTVNPACNFIICVILFPSISTRRIMSRVSFASIIDTLGTGNIKGAHCMYVHICSIWMPLWCKWSFCMYFWFLWECLRVIYIYGANRLFRESYGQRIYIYIYSLPVVDCICADLYVLRTTHMSRCCSTFCLGLSPVQLYFSITERTVTFPGLCALVWLYGHHMLKDNMFACILTVYISGRFFCLNSSSVFNFICKLRIHSIRI